MKLKTLLRLVLCVLPFLLGWSIDFDDPTPEEINKGFILLPNSSWGQQAREENSLRILCIGGSNTANIDAYGQGYVSLLNNYVRVNLSDNEYFRSHSYAWNRGASGYGAALFIGKLYDFELNSSFVEWPNVVIIDVSVNNPPRLDLVQPLLEQLLRSIVFKYKLRGFRSPDFMLYNMPYLREMYVKELEKREDREWFALNYRNDTAAKLFVISDHLQRFAAHYQLPVISWGEAVYDAGIRHFIKYGFAGNEAKIHPWKYSHDGIHMSLPEGTQFGMEHLLGPFFTAAMRSRPEAAQWRGVSELPRMFPPSPVLVEILSYASAFNAHSLFNLKEALVNEQYSEWQVVDIGHGNQCYGSRTANATGEFRFDVPATCKHVGCQVKVRFLHSWNVSYVGNTSCVLHHHLHRTHSGIRLSSVFIDGQEGSMQATIPVESLFDGVNVTEGIHSVKCTNLIEDRLSCMTGLNVNAVVVV